MIPKIIHYCWLSNDPIPDDLKTCMNSWKKYLPDYEFMLWNFERFPKEKSKWVSDAFDNKKYAFAADYIRIYALYHYGGFYLDMDVEVVKPFDPYLGLATMIGYENSKAKGLEVAAFGVERYSPCLTRKCPFTILRISSSSGRRPGRTKTSSGSTTPAPSPRSISSRCSPILPATSTWAMPATTLSAMSWRAFGA